MISLYTDHYFHIGDTHLTAGKPCQDYAISSVNNNAAFAVVSDGCSKGGHTDIGSRLIALSTINALYEHWTKIGEFNENASQKIALHQEIKLSAIQEILGLKLNDMYATCLYACITSKGGFIFMQGDGVIVLKYKDESLALHRYEWMDNTPFYPVYRNEALTNFIQLHGNDLQNLRFNQEIWIKKGEEDFQQSGEKINFTLSQGIQGITVYISEECLNQELEFIGIFSDGVCQIQDVDWKDAVVNFMSFKNTAGEFAKRRMIMGIKNFKQEGKKLLDDIAYAVVRIEIEKEVS